MATILLVGGDAALLEGLMQSLSALGHKPRAADTLHEAREQSTQEPPLVIVSERGLANKDCSDFLSIPLVAGGARVLFATSGSERQTLSPVLSRAVLADLNLPLERNRLVALVQHVEERARATGRGDFHTPSEHRV